MKCLHAISLCSAIILQAGACSPSGSANNGDGGADGGTVLPPGPSVNGTDVSTFVSDSGPTMRPNNLTTNIIAALVPKVTGGFATITGQGKADGTFTIPNVPEGTYYLQYGYPSFKYNYIVTSSRQLDFGSDNIGRADAVIGGTATTLSPMLSGLVPWGTKDHVEVISSNAGAFCYGISDDAAPPAAGATTLMATKLVYPGYCYPGLLIDPAKGDQAYVYQLSTQTSATLGTYTALTNSMLLPTSFGVLSTQDNALTGTLTPAPQKVLSTRLAISQFEQLIATGTPNAQLQGTFMVVESQPGGLAYGPFATSADLVELTNLPGAADKDLGSLTYGNPFPASWGTYVNVVSGFSVIYNLAGAPSPLTVRGGIVYSADASALGATGLTPPGGPVRNIKINGKAATDPLTGITTTPTITFDPPVLGTPTSYTVAIAGVIVANGQLGTQVKAQFRTQGTSITVPAGALIVGGYYVVLINAQYSPKDSFDAPLRQRFPQGSATSISNVVTP